MPLFLAPYAAKPAFWLITMGIIALIIGGLTFGLFWFKHEAAVSHRLQVSAERERDLAQEDALRWKASSEARSKMIQAYNERVKEMNAQLEAANAAIVAANEQARAAQEKSQKFIDDMRKKARDNPDQVNKLGGISRDALRVLLEAP